MVGREYRWHGRVWRVIARWAPPAPDKTFVTREGEIIISRARQVWSPYPSHARCVGYGQGPRNVLLEDVETGERVVRPFRGLRKAAACGLNTTPGGQDE